MPEDTTKRENFSLQISYRQEYVEEEHPLGGLAYPVQSPESFVKVRVSTNNRILCFLTVTSVICLGALVLAPVPIVQGAAAAIWLGSLKIAHRILTSANKKT